MSRSSTKPLPLPPPPSPSTRRAKFNNNTLNSKKRVFHSSPNSSAFMDPEVMEIPPPIHRSFKSKQKQVAIHEIIDVDKDEDAADIMIIDEVVKARTKGKAVQNSSGVYSTIQADDFVGESLVPTNKVEPSMHPTQGPHNIVNLDFDPYDDELFDAYYFNDIVDVDEYAMIQAHFDSVNIPAGVEAAIPWFPDFPKSKKKNSHGKISSSVTGNDKALSPWLSEPALINKKTASVSSSSFQTPGDPFSHSSGGASQFSPSSFPEGSQSNKESAGLQHELKNLPFAHSVQSSQAGGWTNASNVNHSDAVMLPHAVNPTYWDPFSSSMQKQIGSNPSALYHSNFPTPGSFIPPVVPETSMSWWASPMNPKYGVDKHNAYSYTRVDGAYVTPEEVAEIKKKTNVKEEDILNKLQNFKQFDTVEDYSDHHYASSGSSTKQPPKNWAKRIQEEWKILEKVLPDTTIFVRVYESRMDLLRAVIIGAEGTPYHDGLFFFDVFFPTSYPKVPPHVHYHSGGLRLNPNLYNCGKVCLSLLNTWSGNKNEKWIPGTSTMLQVLVSIQALILNQKPYFNEPGWERQSGTTHGESMSRQYNEDTFILSLKTMMYSMRRPPKHFEDFVVGHFYKRAHDILVACKAYMAGAQVGCLVKGGVQDVDEGDKSCSQKFKDSVAGCVNMLVKEFTKLGANDCEKFLIAPNSQNNRVDNMPEASR